MTKTSLGVLGVCAFAGLLGACMGGDGDGAALNGVPASPVTGLPPAPAAASPMIMPPAVPVPEEPMAGPAGMAPDPAAPSGEMIPSRPTSVSRPNGGAMNAPPPRGASNCVPAPEGTEPKAAMALEIVNNLRVPTGSGCATHVAEISQAATAHCLYIAMYQQGDMCVSMPHFEVESCAGFTGRTPSDRVRAAGYSRGAGEVLAFNDDPQRAIDQWVNSVWHRIPLLDPFTTQIGYGSASGANQNCDVIDVAQVIPPDDTVVVYPYDGQTNLTTYFNGQFEGPMPPEPPTGWPSSQPISLYARGVQVTEHVLTKASDTTPIEHVWLDANAEIVAPDMRRSLTNVVFMYANAPFEANTKYRVKISGSYSGGPLMKEWTFTSGAAAPTRRF